MWIRRYGFKPYRTGLRTETLSHIRPFLFDWHCLLITKLKLARSLVKLWCRPVKYWQLERYLELSAIQVISVLLFLLQVTDVVNKILDYVEEKLAFKDIPYDPLYLPKTTESPKKIKKVTQNMYLTPMNAFTAIIVPTISFILVY